jgi:hypothetical protein
VLSGVKFIEGMDEEAEGWEIEIFFVDEGNFIKKADTDPALIVTDANGEWSATIGPFVVGDVVDLAVCEVLRDGWYQVSPAAGDDDTIAHPDGRVCHLVGFTVGEEEIFIDGLDFKNALQLEVSKTAVTSFSRQHDWDIEKDVDPDTLYIYVDGTVVDKDGIVVVDGEVDYTVDVYYLGFDDAGWNVSGAVTIENKSGADAEIFGVTDILVPADENDSDIPIILTCGVDFPHTLPGGETLICTYSHDLDGQFAGKNTVLVEAAVDQTAEDTLVWGNPDPDVDATVEITDTNDTGGVLPDTLSAYDYAADELVPAKTYTYSRAFAYEDFEGECGGPFDFPNTARVIGDEDEVLAYDGANVDVYVQCLKGETAWAANGDVPLELPYNALTGGNWATYVEYAAKTTTLFAGQHIPVGKVTFSAAVDGTITIKIDVSEPGWSFQGVSENVKIEGYAEPPSGNPQVGQFTYKYTALVSPFTTPAIPLYDYYGVHVNVQGPDPVFGP